MGNRTYLTALNERVACPGYRNDFKGEVQTIAETAWHLPLPWLAMFREEDLVEDSYLDANHKELVNSIGPITTRSKAIANLKSAFSPLRSALQAVPELEAYFLFMANELETFRFSFVTIDWL